MHFFIRTDRIVLIPLDKEEIISYLSDYEIVEKTEVSYYLYKKNFGESVFNTIWMVIDIKRKTIVSEIVVKGYPDKNNEIELAYKTFEEERRKGYMSESVATFLKWVSDLSPIIKVRLRIDNDNIPSLKVAEKCGFTETEKGIFLTTI